MWEGLAACATLLRCLRAATFSGHMEGRAGLVPLSLTFQTKLELEEKYIRDERRTLVYFSLGDLTLTLRFTHMKTSVTLSFIVFALVAPAHAGKPHRGGGGQPQQQVASPQQSAPPAPSGPQPPSTRLSQFFNAHLDHILAPIDQQVVLPRTELTQLRESFSDESTKAAQPDKAQYQEAILVCNALNQAMDERDKAIADSQPGNVVQGVQDTHDATVSIPRGRGRGRAAKAAVRQEKYENQKNQNQAAEKGAFLNSNIGKQWLDRSVLLRQNVQQLYSRERDAERQAQQAKTAPISPVTSPAP